jgi:hypothetical protein
MSQDDRDQDRDWEFPGYGCLSLVFVWLFGNVLLIVLGSLPSLGLRTLFPLVDHPGWALGLFLVGSVLYGLIAAYPGNRLAVWGEKVNALSKATKAAIVLSVVFYASFLLIAFIFPRITGQPFQNDWVLLTVATVPVIALVALVLIERATSVKAKFGDFEVEFRRTLTEPVAQTVTAEQDVAAGEIANALSYTQDAPNVFRVPIDTSAQPDNIEFLTLRDYVYELSKVTPIEYIVFTNETDRYLGFMTVAGFKARYPRLGVEIALEGSGEDVNSQAWEYLLDLRERDESLPSIRHDVRFKVVPHWLRQRNSQAINERDLRRLGVSRLYLRQPSVLEAYRHMIENRVSGIPVVDESRRFIGMVTKDRVIQEVIRMLMERQEEESAS